MQHEDYTTLNKVFVLLLIFLSIILSLVDISGIPSCQVLKNTGYYCSSCGLTRDLQSFLQLNFSSPINPNSFAVFIWFAVQLTYRVAFLFTRIKSTYRMRLSDAFVSLISALFVFGKYWI